MHIPVPSRSVEVHAARSRVLTMSIKPEPSKSGAVLLRGIWIRSYRTGLRALQPE